MTDPIRVPAEVLRGLEAVRRDGRTNMFDTRRVAELAEELGYPQAAAWVRRNRQAYAHGVLRGFAADDAREGE